MTPELSFWVAAFAVILVNVKADTNSMVTVRHFKEPESKIDREKLDAVLLLLGQAPPDEKRDVVAEINQMGKGLCRRNPDHPKCKDDTFKAKSKQEAETAPAKETEEKVEQTEE